VVQGDWKGGVSTIDLTPDYQALYERFANELDSAGDLLVRYPGLAHLHSWLAPFAIAFQSATTVEQMVCLREHVACLLSKVAEKAGQGWNE